MAEQNISLTGRAAIRVLRSSDRRSARAEILRQAEEWQPILGRPSCEFHRFRFAALLAMADSRATCEDGVTVDDLVIDVLESESWIRITRRGDGYSAQWFRGEERAARVGRSPAFPGIGRTPEEAAANLRERAAVLTDGGVSS